MQHPTPHLPLSFPLPPPLPLPLPLPHATPARTSVFASSLLMCTLQVAQWPSVFASDLYKWPQWPSVFASSLLMCIFATGAYRLFCFCIVFAHVHFRHRSISSVFASSLLLCSSNILHPLRYCAVATFATARTAAPMAVCYCIVFAHVYATGVYRLFLQPFSYCAVATFAMARVAAASDI